MVGAVSPSSKYLGKKMLSKIDFTTDKLIVELGPGTGVFTDQIIAQMAEDAKLFVFELNDNFYKSLSKRINDPRVQIIHDSAEFIHKYIGETEKLDVVISSLPLMVFPEKLRLDVVNEAYKCLKHNGKYVQFQYSLQSKKLLESIYAEVKIQFTFKNFPPAFVYNCVKK